MNVKLKEMGTTRGDAAGYAAVLMRVLMVWALPASPIA